LQGQNQLPQSSSVRLHELEAASLVIRSAFVGGGFSVGLASEPLN